MNILILGTASVRIHALLNIRKKPLSSVKICTLNVFSDVLQGMNTVWSFSFGKGI